MSEFRVLALRDFDEGGLPPALSPQNASSKPHAPSVALPEQTMSCFEPRVIAT
jgi:hypothetical protein